MEVSTILASFAILISIASLTHSVRQAKVTKRLKIESMLHEAWDLIGGDLGTDRVTTFSNEENLVLARRNVEKAIILDPNYPKSRYVMAVIFEGMGKLDSSELEYNKALNFSNHKLFSATHNLGRMMSKSGRHKEAIVLYKKSLDKSTNKPEIYFNLGVTCHEVGNTEEAIRYFEESINIDKTKSKAYSNIVALLGMSGNIERAEYYLNMAAENMAEDVDVCRNASAMYQAIGNLEKFKIYFEKYNCSDKSTDTNKSCKRDAANGAPC